MSLIIVTVKVRTVTDIPAISRKQLQSSVVVVTSVSETSETSETSVNTFRQKLRPKSSHLSRQFLYQCTIS